MAKQINEPGLTEIKETARGFVGNRPPPKFDRTMRGNRPRVVFCIACGKPDEAKNKLVTWRYCVGYDKVAAAMAGLKVGDWVRVMGWLSTEAVTDNYYRPIVENGVTKKREVLVLFQAEILKYQKRPELQPALIPE